MAEYNIYCDESCHLLKDKSDVMAIGSIWQLKDESRTTAEELRQLKLKHGFPASFEVKWNKVSPAKIDFYSSYVNYFFDKSNLHFRVVIFPNKEIFKQENYKFTQEGWYFNIFFKLLKEIVDPNEKFNIYFDIQDTRSALKIRNLERSFNTYFQVSPQKAEGNKIQAVQSHEVEQIQLVDLLTGIFTYYHRGLKTSAAKRHLIELFESRSGYSLGQSTDLNEKKTNIFIYRNSNGF